MALATQASNKVWLKVQAALAGASPGAQLQFKSLKMWLATQKKNPDLQFIPFSAEQIVTDDGYSPDVDACTVYGVYIKGRRTSGTTTAYVTVHAAATSAVGTTGIIAARLKAADQEYAFISPSGLACETELTVSGATLIAGQTESSAADSADGFVLIGA